MILLFLSKNQSNIERIRVEREHYSPEILTEEQKQGAIEVSSLPLKEDIPGKTYILYYNSVTKALWYEYEDIPPTQEELDRQRIDLLEQAIAELTILMAGGMM